MFSRLFPLLFFTLPALSMVGGYPVTGADVLLKSVVGLSIKYQNQNKSAYCSGTLIGRKTILTAAHCFKNRPDAIVKVAFSEKPFLAIFLAGESEDATSVITSDQIFVHPKYRVAETRNAKAASDVALIYLPRVAPAGSRVLSLVPYPILPIYPDYVKVVASGGNDEKTEESTFEESVQTHVKQFNFPVIKYLDNFVRGLDMPLSEKDILNTLDGITNPSEGSFMIHHTPTVKVTYGDSGAPALYFREGRPYVLGVLSGRQSFNNVEVGAYFVNLHEAGMNRWLRMNIR